MSDPTLLRELAGMVPEGWGDLCREAAIEIERLRAQVDHAVRRIGDLEYFWMGTKEELWGPIKTTPTD